MHYLLLSSLSVTVSLVRIKGTDCKAVELGQVSNKTGGQVSHLCIVLLYIHVAKLQCTISATNFVAIVIHNFSTYM